MATWEENLHPRAGKGSNTGGQFVSKGGSIETDVAKYKEHSSSRGMVDAARIAPIDNIKRKPTKALNKAVEDYSSVHSDDLNSKLRRGKKLSDIQSGIVRQLDRVIAESSLKSDTLLYRQVETNIFKKMKPGDAIDDKGFISTSLHPLDIHYGPDIQTMKILAPKGSKGLSLWHYSEYPAELEFLIDRGSSLIYLGDDSDGSKVFKLHQGNKK